LAEVLTRTLFDGSARKLCDALVADGVAAQATMDIAWSGERWAGVMGIEQWKSAAET
jgi:hypothetical protein